MSVENSLAAQTDKRKGTAQSFVERQLAQTGRMLRVNDAITTILAGIIWVLAVLLMAVVIDAWIFPLTITVRWIVFSILIGGWCSYTAWKLFPVINRQINPSYSARMIEKTTDTFHNSLVNYTFLSRTELPANPHVIQAVSQKAAEDLAGVTDAERIDRTNLIRVGLLLVALTSVFVAYSILSPKSPWPTILRVFTPFANISRPSSVRIDNVSPGDAEVFYGRRLLISADVKGPHDPEDVSLIFSTLDRRMTNVRLPMRAVSDGSPTYQVELGNTPLGIDASLVYSIQAGDGRTRDFLVQVNANPTLTVNEAIIVSPDYTQLPIRTLSPVSEVTGVEGAKVQLTAASNLPIQTASIELLKLEPGDSPSQAQIVTTIRMKADNQVAQGEFVLRFDRNANQPELTHFQLRLTSTTGARNETTNIYPVRIIPDLAPEVRITKPKVEEQRLPVNHPLTWHVLAQDLDFELSQVGLNFDLAGSRLIDHVFALPPPGQRQAYSGTFTFLPEQHGLKPGDRVQVQARAMDNRRSSVSGLPEPNEARTPEYLVIIDPPSSSPPPKDGPDPAQEEPEPGQETGSQAASTESENSQSQKSTSEEGADEANPSQSEPSAQANPSGNQDPTENPSGDSTEKQPPAAQGKSEQSEPQETNEHSEKSGSQPTPDSPGEKNEGEQGNGKQQDSPTEKNEGGGRPDKEGQGKSESNQGKGNESGSDSSDSKEKGAPGAANQGESSDESPSSMSNDSNSGSGKREKKPDAQGDPSNAQRDKNLTEGEETPLTDDATDTERFEKLRQLMQKEQKSTPPSSNNEPNQNNPNKTPPDQGENRKDNSANSSSPGEHPPKQPEEDSQNKSDSSQKNNSSPNEKSPSGNSPSNSTTPKSPSESKPESNPKRQPDNTRDPNQPSGENSQPMPAGKENQPEKSPSDGEKNTPDVQPKTGKGNQAESGGSQKSDTGADGPEKTGDATGGKDSGKTAPQPGEQSSSSSSGSTKAETPTKADSAKSSSGQVGNKGAGGGKNAGGNLDELKSSEKSGGPPISGMTSEEPLTPEEVAELKYKKETTELALKYLKEKEQMSDREELLRQLNMTDQQLKDFQNRWQEMVERAGTGDKKAQKQYDQALKALALRGRPSKVTGRDDRMDNLSEGAAVSRPPAELEGAFLDYLKTLNRPSGAKR